MEENHFTQQVFQSYLNAHKLMGTKCKTCKTIYLPPRPMCSHCGGNVMEWAEVTGNGTLTAFTSVYIAPTAMIAAGYGRDNPYCSGVVRLDGNLSISAQIIGVDAAHPETIQVGMPVKIAYLDRGVGEDRKTFLAFEPA